MHRLLHSSSNEGYSSLNFVFIKLKRIAGSFGILIDLPPKNDMNKRRNAVQDIPSARSMKVLFIAFSVIFTK